MHIKSLFRYGSISITHLLPHSLVPSHVTAAARSLFVPSSELFLAFEDFFYWDVVFKVLKV